jgi:TM2 domain-containing membrane protein YozV
MSTADEIKKLNELLRDGVLTQEEFDKQKDKLLNSNSISSSQQDWLVALLLCFFIGVIGAHRFYVGKIGTGLLMVFTLGGLGIWTFIDLILIIVGKFKNKDGEVLSRI